MAKYDVIGSPRVEADYCDEYETVMVIDLRREDGEDRRRMDCGRRAGLPARVQRCGTHAEWISDRARVWRLDGLLVSREFARGR